MSHFVTKMHAKSVFITYQAKDLKIINIYAPNDLPSKHVKQEMTELKGQKNIPT